MKRTTVLLETEVERELRGTADARGVSVSLVVREALAEYARREARKRIRSLRFLAIGRSGREDVADRHEEILVRELRPHGEGGGRPSRRRRRT